MSVQGEAERRSDPPPDAPLAPCPDLGFDVDRPIRSESVACFVTTADGTSAVSVRLCRYPEARRSWIWAHVLTPAGSWAYNVDHAACAPTPVAVDGAEAVYVAGESTALVRRRGPAHAPRAVEVDLMVPAHVGSAAPDSDGPVTAGIRGRFEPTTSAGATLPGRTEVFGTARLTVTVPGRQPFTVAGHAQFHEQLQDRPRFVTPFTYASLRGDDLSVIALIGPRGSGGFGRGTGGDRRFSRAVIPEPVDGHHPIELHDAGGGPLVGRATVRHEIIIPVYGLPWWGTIVSAELAGHRLSGSVNRWRYGRTGPPDPPGGSGHR